MENITQTLFKSAAAWRKTGAMAICFSACATAHATLNISALNTGAGDYGINNGAPIIDSNWKVTLIPPPANGIPPGGIPNGNAYLVPNNIGFPIPPWVPNSSLSTWITYSYPTQVGGDNTGGTYQYQLQFTALTTGSVDISLASDNNSSLFINGGLVVNIPDPQPFSSFQDVDYSFKSGQNYTVDFDVYNIPQGNGNPTGANVQFSGDVNVAPVPEASTVFAGAMMLLPFGVSAARIMRKNRMA